MEHLIQLSAIHVINNAHRHIVDHIKTAYSNDAALQMERLDEVFQAEMQLFDTLKRLVSIYEPIMTGAIAHRPCSELDELLSSIPGVGASNS